MRATLETIHEELVELKRDVQFIKHMLDDEGDLTYYAKRALERARKTPEHEYVDL